MQFKTGTHVYTADNQDMGAIDRVVLDPRSKVVTHIVVRQGLLFTEDKVIPIGYIASATDDKVSLDRTEDQLPEFAPFEESYYRPLDDNLADPRGDARPYLGYPPLGTAWWGYPGYLSYGPYPVNENYSAVEVEQNIPDHTVGLAEGAQVLSADGETLGEVTRVVMDASSARASHIVVSKGWLFKERKLIPTSWINQMEEETVHLSINQPFFDQLPAFET